MLAKMPAFATMDSVAIYESMGEGPRNFSTEEKKKAVNSTLRLRMVEKGRRGTVEEGGGVLVADSFIHRTRHSMIETGTYSARHGSRRETATHCLGHHVRSSLFPLDLSRGERVQDTSGLKAKSERTRRMGCGKF